MHLSPQALFLSALGVATAQQWNPTDACPLLGPALFKDFDVSNSTAFKNATKAFPGIIESIFNSSAVNASTASFVIDVYSTYTNTSLYTYTHKATAPALNETFPPELNDETIFRVGSVSKLYTVYAILAHAKSLDVFDLPVTSFIPELEGNSAGNASNARIVWENVTVGALASHQAGVGTFPIKSLSCEPASNNGSDQCSILGFLGYMKNGKRPVQPVFQSSQYSDGGFGVLGRVLERMTNKTYNEAIQDLLAQPLGLKNTGSFVPAGKDLNAIVLPPMPISSWGWDNQISAPSGGLYSNAADFRATGLAILHSQLLAPEITRAWMKPHAHTASLISSVGAPWEINRLTLPVSPGSNRTRVSDLYTKAGGQPGYTALFMLSPDHGVGISVLVAGESALGDRWPLRAAAAEAFVTAAEHAGKEYAVENFAGTFVDQADPTSNLTLAVNKDSVGLEIATLFVAGVNAKPAVLLPGGNLPADLDVLLQIYPTGLEFPKDGNSSPLQYRAVTQVLPVAERTGLFDDVCISWLTVGASEDEQQNSLDEFILEVMDGKLVSLQYPPTKQQFTRVQLLV
ncbi:hypothetical protein OPT61_g8794 [Boeremia exigua]|uniref:Uncharacterized protein n=1 Tax=Boeremia exigua TaxID=749465 RepID=A0ACC2HXJ7_9PLEO|nr:hypothetical protein OPT61_g8794 [Boeremia exigua]